MTRGRTPILNAVGILLFLASLYLVAQLVPAVAFPLNVLAYRVYKFPTAAIHRNWRCTYSDAWSLDPDAERIRLDGAIRETFKVDKRDGLLEHVTSRFGNYWIPAGDIDTLAETIGEQQQDIYGGVAIQAGDVVLDCGANVGVYTRHALDKGAKLVVAIEPAPKPLECLRRNFQAEIASHRVIVYPKGVWNKDAELELSISNAFASTGASVILDRGGKGPVVPLTTIDKLVVELGLPSVDFIKMDIEGAETQALEGAIQTVRHFHPRMAISLEHRPSDPDTIPDSLHKLWPDYWQQCGPCAGVNDSIQPDVLFAHAP